MGEMLARWPGVFAAAGLVSAHYEWRPVDVLVECLTGEQTVPIWFVHAWNDRMCPFAPLDKIVKELKAKSKADVRFTVYEEKRATIGHFADRVAYWAHGTESAELAIGDEFFTWLVDQMSRRSNRQPSGPS